MWTYPYKTADLLTFICQVLNGKLRFLCHEYYWFYYWVLLQVFLLTKLSVSRIVYINQHLTQISIQSPLQKSILAVAVK